jgi:CDP-glycerol glycerophosphotransferase (TagB/SpsB family)
MPPSEDDRGNGDHATTACDEPDASTREESDESSASRSTADAGPTPESFERLEQARFVLATALFAVVARLSAWYGRDPSVWVFGARGGAAFADNAKYLYLHTVAHHPEVRAVWLSRDSGVVADLRDAGYDAHHVHSVRGVLVALRAGVVLLTEDFRDVNVAAIGGARVVQLWHGIPLKRIGWDAELPALPLAVRLCLGHLQRQVSQLVLTASELTDAFASGLRIDRDAHAVAGYPRTDALAHSIPGEDVGLDSSILTRLDRAAADGHLLFYLPTYRGNDEHGFARHLEFDRLERFLAERDAYLAVKPHPKETVDLDATGPRILEIPPDQDVYPLARRADALLTDYSSIAFDFFRVDRPIAFYAYDRERYERTRGFYLDYDAVTPGPVAEDFDALLDALDDVLDAIETAGDSLADDWQAERATVRDRLFDYPDGDHAERTYQVVADADQEARRP